MRPEAHGDRVTPGDGHAAGEEREGMGTGVTHWGELYRVLWETAPRATGRVLILSVVVALLHGLALIWLTEAALALGARLSGAEPAAGGLSAIGGLLGAAGFLAVVSGFALGKVIALREGLRVTEAAVAVRTGRLIEAIRATDLASLEAVGRERIRGVLTRDTRVIAGSAILTLHTLQSLVLLAVGGVYLAIVALPSLVLVVLVGLVGQRMMARADRALAVHGAAANEAEDRFFGLVGDTLAGLKALKLAPAKFAAMQAEDLRPAAEATRWARVAAGAAQAQKLSLFNWLYFPTLAAVAFGLPHYLPAEALHGVAASLLMLILLWVPAVDVLLNGPNLISAGLSVTRLRALEADLVQVSAHRPASQKAPARFERIRLRGLAFVYRDAAGEATFTVGPLDLSIEAGELLFLAGANGSGKSTVLKLLTGLYPPTVGDIVVDERALLAEDYRGLFAGVFADFHLFRGLYGAPVVDPAQVEDLLRALRVEDKVALAGGRLVNFGLSAGQRRRLALIAAYLEDRPIYVFDEWTADQDPEFRHYFYAVLLPQLKALGKTVIVATHDETWFSSADRVMTLADGRITAVAGSR